MKRYIFIISLSLVILPKAIATTGIPMDTEICKPGMGLEVEKGSGSVGIKERGSYCNVEVGGDPVDVFGLKSDYCIEGPLDDGCEEAPPVEIPPEKPKEATGKLPGGLKWYEVPGQLGGGRYSGRGGGFDCVSSVSFSSIFSSLGACSPGGSSSGGKANAQSPKPDPKTVGGNLRMMDPKAWGRFNRFEVRKALEKMVGGFSSTGALSSSYTTVDGTMRYTVTQDAGPNLLLTTTFFETKSGSISTTVVLTVETPFAKDSSKKYVQYKEILVGYIDGSTVKYVTTGNIDNMSLKDMFSVSNRAAIGRYINKTWEFAKKSP